MRKCDNCRSKKIKCSPVDRRWPEDGKCDNCKKHDLRCGPNTRKSTPTARTDVDAIRNSPRLAAVEQLPNSSRMMLEVHSRGRPEHNPPPSISLQRDATPNRLGRALAQGVAMREPSPRPPVQNIQHVFTNNSAPDSETQQRGQSRDSSLQKRSHADAFENRVYRATDLSRGGCRLFELFAGTSGPVRGKLIRAEPGAVSYEAVSHAWGSETVTSAVEIQDTDHQLFQLPITPNLEIALKQFRRPHDTRLLWIDQICINQVNAAEKSAQVVLMGQIFSNATTVLVWLGEEDFETARAFAFVRQMGAFEAFESVPDNSRHRNPEALSDRIWFLKLLQRPWFSRRWVIQEVALAQKIVVHCGGHMMPWEDLSTTISLYASQIGELKQSFDYHPDAIGDFTWLPAVHLADVTSNLLRRDQLGPHPTMTLEALVLSLQHFESSNFHDTFYAILSLASDVSDKHWSNHSKRQHTQSERENVDIGPLSMNEASEREARLMDKFGRQWRDLVRTYPIDYGKPVYEVCKDFLDWTLRPSRSLDIICQPWAPTKPTDNLPSWIPSLSGLALRRDRQGRLRRVKADPLVATSNGSRNYNASGRMLANYTIHESGREGILSVEGFVLDTINEKLLPAQSGNIPIEWLTVAGWTDPQQLPPDEFWRTLVADRGPEQKNPPTYYPLACRYARGLGVVGDDVFRTDVPDTCPRLVKEFLRRAQSVVWQRSLIVTEDQELLGLVPYETKTTDLICILFGCSVPVILRRDKDNIHHKFIGECYVHSMMDGSAFRIRDAKLAQAQERDSTIQTINEKFQLR